MRKALLYLLFLIPVNFFAQTISGNVKDNEGSPLSSVTVLEKGATNKATTDEQGNFNIRVSIIPTTLIVKSFGYTTVEVEVKSKSAISATLEMVGSGLKETAGVGNLTKNRTVVSSASPVTIISVKDLMNTGKNDLEEALSYALATINTGTNAVAGSSSHFDGVDMKNLGASRVLVLVNGKRKNTSAIAHANNTYNRGEVGADFKGIPVASIERVEVLRDGASAQYGTDAIAGVINIVTKKDGSDRLINGYTGITTEGDGFEIGGDINGTVKNDKGAYVNYTFALQRQNKTDRSGEPGNDDYYGVNDSWTQSNKDLGMTVGQNESYGAKMLLNAALPFKNGKGEWYAMTNVGLRTGNSFGVYNAPYMVDDTYNIISNTNGFGPELKANVTDNLNILGVKLKAGKFDVDVYGNLGVNNIDYTVNNTINPTLGNMPKISFDAGSQWNLNVSGNIDVKRSFDKVNVAFGAEYKMEEFKIKDGEPNANLFPVGGGEPVSFTGYSPVDRLSEDRDSYGIYANADFDVSDDFLVGASVRYDGVEDFDSFFSYKVNARYNLGDKGAFRVSYGTNFRAPAMQQVYSRGKQNLVSNYNLGKQILVNHADPFLTTLGINTLKNEVATNLNAGLTVTPMKNLTLSLDYYRVDIDDRIGLTSLEGSLATVPSTINTFMAVNEVSSVAFFANVGDTETQGIDFSAKYDRIKMSKGYLAVVANVNWNTTKVSRIEDTPTMLSSNGYTLIGRSEIGRIEVSQPEIKGGLSFQYAQENFNVNLTNTYFGEVSWLHNSNPNLDQSFGGQIITDLNFGYQLTDIVRLNLAVNNLLNSYPDEIEAGIDNSIDFGGRFKYNRMVNQIGILGTNVRAGITIGF